jgi:outer membrane protein assembly factor BamD
MKKILFLLLLSVMFLSCSPFQKALKSEDVEIKYTEANRLFEAKKYSKSLRLFEQLSPLYKGKPQAEKMFYMYAQALYKTKEFYAAGYQLEKFVSSYPKSEKAEEAAYLATECFTKLSPVYTLDQVDTEKAIEKSQTFIDNYPESQYLPEANVNVKLLRGKLEKKAYEIAKQYNSIADYKAALVALDLFIADFPGTEYKEKALFYRLDSAYKLAINSVPNKMEERLKVSKIAYSNLIKFKADTQFKSKADQMLATIDKDLQQFSK